MKTLQKIAVLFCLTLIISCGGNDDNDNPTGGDAFLTATVDGGNFAALEVAVAATVSSNVLAVQGSNADGNFIRLNITNYSGTGTYTTGDNISNVSSVMYGTVSPVASWTSTFNIGSGTVTITEDSSTHVKGTFSFSGLDAGSNTTKDVTNGEFSAPKQ